MLSTIEKWVVIISLCLQRKLDWANHKTLICIPLFQNTNCPPKINTSEGILFMSTAKEVIQYHYTTIAFYMRFKIIKIIPGKMITVNIM